MNKLIAVLFLFTSMAMAQTVETVIYTDGSNEAVPQGFEVVIQPIGYHSGLFALTPEGYKGMTKDGRWPFLEYMCLVNPGPYFSPLSPLEQACKEINQDD